MLIHDWQGDSSRCPIHGQQPDYDAAAREAVQEIAGKFLVGRSIMGGAEDYLATLLRDTAAAERARWVERVRELAGEIDGSARHLPGIMAFEECAARLRALAEDWAK